MRARTREYQEKILRTLEHASLPLDAENIRLRAGIANWQTCMKHLLELTLSGAIQGVKTSKSWIFFPVDHTQDPNRG